MRARACYLDTNVGQGPVKAKCRVVLKGFADPDLEALQRNSPTATPIGFYMLLIIAAGPGWPVGAADASAAFLQGSQVGRDEPLYMEPPADPLIEASGRFQESTLYKIEGNIYGLANAPLAWSKEVVSRMKAVGFTIHTLAMCFIHRDRQGHLDCLAIPRRRRTVHLGREQLRHRDLQDQVRVGIMAACGQ